MEVNMSSWVDQKEWLEQEANIIATTFGVEVSLVPIPWLDVAVTIGPFIFIPRKWSTASAYGVLHHEVAGHVRQYATLGLGLPTVGIPLFLLIYGLLLLPVGLALGRVLLETLAVRADWQARAARMLDFPFVYPSSLNESMCLDEARWVKKLWSSTYLWAAPAFITRPILAWMRRRITKKFKLDRANKEVSNNDSL